MGRKKKEGEDDEYMSHKVSYKWIRKTQVIPRFGGVLQECGDFTWRVSECEELVGVLSKLTCTIIWIIFQFII